MLGGICDNTCCNGCKFCGGNGTGRGANGVLRVSPVVAVAALVVEVVLVPVVAVVVLLCTLPLVRLVLPSISHAQWVPIRRCTVGQLMVVAEVACLVQPSMVAD